jgi:hypothetical protein
MGASLVRPPGIVLAETDTTPLSRTLGAPRGEQKPAR